MNPIKLPDEHKRRLAYMLDHLSKIIIPTSPLIVSSKVTNCDFLTESVVIELKRIIFEADSLVNSISEKYDLQSKENK